MAKFWKFVMTVGTSVLILTGIWNLSMGTSEGEVVLDNQHLIVTFRESAHGPRLDAIRSQRTGRTYRFEQSRTLGLALIDPRRINDSRPEPTYVFEDSFQLVESETNRQQTVLTIRFSRNGVGITVTYELRKEAPVLQKTVVCEAEGKETYVAGVIDWDLRPVDLSFVWPQKEDTVAQPLILKGETEGLFVTTEWPRSQFQRTPDGRIQLSYRPGYRLARGESKEVAAGAIGFFSYTGETEFFDAARRSFIAHVTSRLEPRIPFPVKFTTWGPWLGQARADRLLEIMDDMAYVGTDLVHFDAGWQWPDRPLSDRLPKFINADDSTWDRMMTEPGRLPNGLLPIMRQAEKRGMAVSLWFDGGGSVFVREDEDWAIRDQNGNPIYGGMWEGRWPEAPVLSMSHLAYRKALEEFVLQQMERYDLGGVMFDNNLRMLNFKDFAAGRLSLASGWNSEDVMIRGIWEILEAAEMRKPGIYRFLCMGVPWPWNLKYATHIHAGDPGTAPAMKEAMATDYPARSLVYERYLAWRDRYFQFVPPWGIKGDIAGWSVQQASPIPINLKHTEQVIGSGEGWTYNMMMCFATTAVRDIRFSFRQMPQFDKDILKEWLVWDRRRSHFIHNLKLFSDPPDDPNRGLIGISHVGNGQGVLYLFNRSFETAEMEIRLDEQVGLDPSARGLSAFIVYPMKAALGSGQISYGQRLRVPVIGKDSVVIEVGLEEPAQAQSYEAYQRVAGRVDRSFHTRFLAELPQLLKSVQEPVRLEVGDHPHDRIVAKQIVETLGAALGRRVEMGEWLATPAAQARSRLIIGTHEGLKDHPQIGEKFQETLYNRYIRWGERLVSAPLLAQEPQAAIPTFYLIAPRPEQLQRLPVDLLAKQSAKTESLLQVPTAENSSLHQDLSFSIATPGKNAILRFQLVMSQDRRQGRHIPVPGNLEMIRFEIVAENRGKRRLLWSEEIPPMYGPMWREDPSWWQDRVISLAGLGEGDVKLRLRAWHLDGRKGAAFRFGFRGVSVAR